MKNNTDLTQGSVGKLLLKLAIPAIVAQLINVLYNMVDRMYIGHIEHIGDVALTGVGVTMPLITAISAFAALVSMGSAPRASIMMGRKRQDEAENILGNSTTLLIIIALLSTIIIQIFGKDLLLLFGASENTLSYAWEYMSIYSFGTIFVQLTLGLNAFISCQGFASVSMKTTMIGAILNIILDPIFIFFFDLGVLGAALATIFSQAVSCIWVISFLLGKQTKLRLKIKYMALKPSVFLPCVALGLAPFIMQFTESILSMCFNTSLLEYGGDIAVGTMTILSSIMSISMLPLHGLTQGAQPIISYNFGAENYQRVRQAFMILLTTCLLFSSIMWAFVQFAPQIFIQIFTNKTELIEYAIPSLKTYMALSCLFGAQIACQQTFIALGNAKTSLFLALLRKVILLIPFIYLFPNFFDDKVFAVFLAEPVADLLAVCTTVILFFYANKDILKKQVD